MASILKLVMFETHRDHVLFASWYAASINHLLSDVGCFGVFFLYLKLNDHRGLGGVCCMYVSNDNFKSPTVILAKV